MPIPITHVATSNLIVISGLLAALIFTLRKTPDSRVLDLTISQELKGFSILAIVLAHISYMLVSDAHFLYPLNKAAGVGVDLFLLLSGYGLSVSMLKKTLPAPEFYKHRLIKVFIPFWLVLAGLFIADAVFLGKYYSGGYIAQSLLGWFPKTRPYEDVNSPFWYITWMLLFYVLYPWLFNRNRLWLTALAFSVIANVIAMIKPFNMDTNWWHRMHTDAFSLGILAAWLLTDTTGGKTALAVKINHYLDKLALVPRLGWIILTALIGMWGIANANVADWPGLAPVLKNLGLSDVHVIGQTASLVTVVALLVMFSVKKYESRLLSLFGAYSYEIYLLHWPLMARYDVFFHHLPAWLATFIWLGVLLGLSYGLQKLSGAIGAWVDRQW